MLSDHQKLINLSMKVAVSIAILRMCLLAVPEVVPFGAELGELLYDVSLAFTTAWLFQWLVIIRPERTRRLEANRMLLPRVDALVSPAIELVLALQRTTGRDIVGWPDKSDFLEMCAEINGQRPLKRFLAASSWWPYLEFIQRRRAEAQRGLEPFYDRMDLELAHVLGRERESGLMLSQCEHGYARPSGEDVRIFAEDLYGWISAVRAVKNQRDAVLRQPFDPRKRTRPG